VFATEGKLNIANLRAKAVAYINLDFLDMPAILKLGYKEKGFKYFIVME
jgi:hypothetical protein